MADVFILIICIVVIAIFYFITKQNKKFEGLTNTSTNANDVNDANTKKATPKNLISILQDSLFANVIYYENDEDPYANGQKLGLQKCLDNCVGTCVEFGVTGNATCYPQR